MRKTSPPGPLSVPERGPGGEVFAKLRRCQNFRPPESFAAPHDRNPTAKKPHELPRGYELLHGLIEHDRQFPVLPFDLAALDPFDAPKRRKIRVGTMDLRIAAIALAHDLTAVTVNISHFAQVPGLRLEDGVR